MTTTFLFILLVLIGLFYLLSSCSNKEDFRWGGWRGWRGPGWRGRRWGWRGWGGPRWWAAPYYVDLPYVVENNSCSENCLNSYKRCIDSGTKKEECVNNLDSCIKFC